MRSRQPARSYLYYILSLRLPFLPASDKSYKNISGFWATANFYALTLAQKLAGFCLQQLNILKIISLHCFAYPNEASIGANGRTIESNGTIIETNGLVNETNSVIIEINGTAIVSNDLLKYFDECDHCIYAKPTVILFYNHKTNNHD